MIAKDSRIYLAGHRGLIGTEILKSLQSAGYSDIICKTSKELDLTCQQDVASYISVERPEYVILNAAMQVNSDTLPQSLVNIMLGNTMIVANVIEASLRAGVKRLIYICSAACYPYDAKAIQTPNGPALAESELQPGRIERGEERFYVMPKMLGKELCDKINLSGAAMKCAVLVPTHVYGEVYRYESGRLPVCAALIKRFHEAVVNDLPEVVVWGTGALRRELTYAGDVADACVLLLENEDACGSYNIGQGAFVTIRELAETIREISGYQGRIVFDATKPEAVELRLLHSDKLRGLGWRPMVSFQEGIKRAYEYFCDQYGQ